MSNATSSTRSVIITKSLCPRMSFACCASCTRMAPSSPTLELRGKEHSNCPPEAQRTVAPKLSPSRNSVFGLFVRRMGRLIRRNTPYFSSKTPEYEVVMDLLAEVLSLLRTKGRLYGRLEFTAPWGFAFPGDKGICLLVTRGACFLGVDHQALVPLVGGDFVFLPAPHSYSLRSSPDLAVRSVLDVISPETFQHVRMITEGGGGMPTSVIAGCFTFATPESAWLVKDLPPIIHVSASEAHAPPWFQATLQFIAAELVQDLPGSSVIVDRLAEVLFVQAMRTRIHAPYPEGNPSWLRGLADPHIGAALRLMHAE